MSLTTYLTTPILITGSVIAFVIIGTIAYLMNKSKNKTSITGGYNMDKLEEDVFKELEGAYHDMMTALEDAEKKNEGIDLKTFVNQQASRFKNLNNYFREAKQRISGKKKF